MHRNWLKILLSIVLASLVISTAYARNDIRESHRDKKQGYNQQPIQRPVRPSAPHPQSRPERGETRVKREHRTVRQPGTSRHNHDINYQERRAKIRRHPRHYTTYHYHTHYLAPIVYYFYPIGFVLDVLPTGYISFTIGGYPYYYYGGVYYRHINDDYVVVSAPAGAIVYELPEGFIAFELRGRTYYFVNDTYYIWDQYNDYYVVVAKPDGADQAMARETKGRLFAYPKNGQSEEQQAKDRYACHRWAVKQTGIDPIESNTSLTSQEDNDYKRALTACLEARGYTVK